MSKPRREHATKAKLIETVLELAGNGPLEVLSVDQVLGVSQISRGSLYHHFEDFYHLLEVAEARRFAKYVDLSIEKMSEILQRSKTKEEARLGLLKSTRATQSPDIDWMRRQRIMALARASESTRFHKALGQEQQRMTDAFVEIISAAQEKGIVRPDLDPRAIAVLIQAYTIGRVVDDITTKQVDPDAWYSLIDNVADMILGL